MTVKVSKPAINVREELADLRKPTGLAGEAMLRAETPQEQFNLIGAGRRNILINGSHIVNQRNNLPTSGTSGGYPATDRWKYYSTTTSCSLSLSSVTLPDGTAANALKAASTTSGTHPFDWYQKVEPINYAHLDGQTVTMSCWVRSNSSNARLMLWQSGTGSIGQTPYTGSGDWQYLTVSGVVDASAASLEAYAAIGTETNLSGVAVTSGEYIEFTRCQLELGKVATPFEHRSYGEELALCQRYAVRLGAHPNDAANEYNLIGSGWWRNSVNDYSAQIHVSLPVSMRHDNYSVTVVGDNEFYLQGGTQSGTTEWKTINVAGCSTNMVWLDFRPSVASGTAPCIPCVIGAKNGSTDSNKNALIIDAEL